MGELTVSIHQPNFMPWLKLLDKILASDVYVAYDTVQYTKSEYHARQRVKTHHGLAWLSVPVVHVKGVQQTISDVRIENAQPFRRRHLRTLRLAYGATPYFDEVFGVIERVYARDQDRLVDLNVELIEALCGYLEASVRVVRASTLPHAGDRADRLVRLVRAVGGNVHLTSTYDTDQRVEWWKLASAGITVDAQSFDHPVYEQIGDGFVPGIAAIDMLFTCGRQTSEILAQRRSLVRVDPILEDVSYR
ncbi:WbqC family protein [Phytoactinopolyspora endophytica]|uniref:WbqC family protein n=1 Tax=Phytoactinopolyspora endophytica TaxID=1642495 RepID=UPI00101BC4F6|nr:WbqC family protein [Phytoactinopolyspora endophytica]